MALPRCLTENLTDYIMEKRVIIKSPWFRIPHLLLMMVGFSGIVFYYVGYSLCFLKVRDADGDAKIELLNPTTPSTMTSDDDEPEVEVKEDPPYCLHRNITFGKWRVPGQRWGRCRSFDRLELMQSQTTDEDLFFATRVEMLHQRPSEALGGQHVREPPREGHKREYTLKIELAVPVLGKMFQGRGQEHTQGFLEVQGAKLRFPCIGASCSTDISDFESWKHHNYCGSNVDSGDACFSAGSDYLSVRQMLRAANVSLDDRKFDSISVRGMGIALNLEVFYSNTDPFEFWRWPVGPKLSYTYRFSKVKYRSDEHIYFYQQSLDLDMDKRTVQRYAGILIHAEVNGRIGTLSISRLFLTILVNSAALSLADMIVQRVLVAIYRRTNFRALNNVSKLYSVFSKDVSPVQKDFDDHNTEDKFIELSIELTKERWRSVDDDEDEGSESGSSDGTGVGEARPRLTAGRS